jgi:hypothetical protein
VQRLRAFLGPRADSPIDELSKADLVAFRAARSAQVSSTSVNLDIRVARMLFLCARRNGVLSENPAEFVAQAKPVLAFNASIW